jgi:CheY-like chemotaxis protein
MLDRIRLFKVIHSIVVEENYFLLAQDLYGIFSILLTQLESLESTIAEYNAKRIELFENGGDLAEVDKYAKGMESLSELLQERVHWEIVITELRSQAHGCWYCAPVDSPKISRQNMAPLDYWISRSDERFSVHDDARVVIDEIKAKCSKLLEEMFPEMLSEAQEESRIERDIRACMTNRKLKFGNCIPAGLLHEFDTSNKSFIIVTNFPTSHFYIADPKFASLLRYSSARMLAFPLLSFIVNTKETHAVVQGLNKSSALGKSSTILFYRTATRDVVAVHWEICNRHVDTCWVMAQGVDITKELELSRSMQAESMQTMLRQWLHSIRNASFEQQAQAIHSDVEDIQTKLADAGIGGAVKKEIDDVLGSLRTLIYTTQASLGLIDQALATKGVMSYTNMASFVDSLMLFAANFSHSEGIDDMPSSFNSYLNGNIATSVQYKDLYVGGDMMSVKVLVDNIFSNAVRYTDLNKGVHGDVNVHTHGNIMQCVINITDYCPGGLPQNIIEYYEKHIGSDKVVDLRHKEIALADDMGKKGSPTTFRNSISGRSRSNSIVDSDSPMAPSPSNSSVMPKKTRSSLTGVPHIVQLYHKLTASGEQDFDMAIVTQLIGTSYNIRFSVGLIAPPKTDDDGDTETGMETMRQFFSVNDQKVLVVDDSAVVRRLLARFLEKLAVPCHLCNDGTDAKEWLEKNSDKCFGIITDLEMPKMGGDALIKAAKVIRASLPCVIVSGNHLSADQIPEGASKVLLKPIILEQLKEILLHMYDEIHMPLVGGK